MIRLEHVCKTFGSIAAVRDLSFELGPGRVHGLLGPNGAGKTTTMRLLTGYFAPDQGQVLIEGQGGVWQRETLRAKIGYLPENNPLYGDMTVLEHLVLAADMRGLGKARKRAVTAVAARCQLETLAAAKVATLSKGQRQRLGLAQALLGDPAILVLDEPSSGLDPLQAEQLASLILELGQERTLLLSTHQLEFATSLCQQLMIMRAGQMVFSDSVAAFQASQPSNVARLMCAGDEHELRRRLSTLSAIRVIEAQPQMPQLYLLHGELKPETMQRIFALLHGMPVTELTLVPASATRCFAALTTAEVP